MGFTEALLANITWGAVRLPAATGALTWPTIDTCSASSSYALLTLSSSTFVLCFALTSIAISSSPSRNAPSAAPTEHPTANFHLLSLAPLPESVLVPSPGPLSGALLFPGGTRGGASATSAKCPSFSATHTRGATIFSSFIFPDSKVAQ
ncbi:hypothetical protein V2J09_022324 [Rumex salicifolius]